MKKDICQNCTFYTAYYKEWATHYSKLNEGFCKIKQGLSKFNVSCESFKSNEIRELSRDNLRLIALDNALKSINDIALILKNKQAQSVSED